MTEKEVFFELKDWARDYYPEGLVQYYMARDKKKAAFELLKVRIRRLPGYLYLLPEELMVKMGCKVDRGGSQDPRVISLITAVKGQFWIKLKAKYWSEVGGKCGL